MQQLLLSRKLNLLKIVMVMMICFSIILTSILVNTEKTYAFAPLVIAGVTIAPEAIIAGATLLTACGITFASTDDMRTGFIDYYTNATSDIKTTLQNNVYVGTTLQISEALYNSAKSYINQKLLEGTNILSNINQYNEQGLNVPQGYIGAYSVQGRGISLQCGLAYVQTDYVSNKIKVIGTWFPSAATADWVLYESTYQQYIGENLATFYEYAVNYIDSNGQEVLQGTATTYSISQTAVPQTVTPSEYAYTNTPTTDWINPTTGTRAINVPITETEAQAITPTQAQGIAETTTPQTVTDVTTTVSSSDKTWWEQLIGGIATGLGTIGENILGLPVAIATAFTGALTTIGTKIDSLTESVNSNQEPDETERTKNYKLPDLFILTLMVILATIRLVVRSVLFINDMAVIPANDLSVNENMIAGLDFLKNQNIPVINISFWTLFTALITFLYLMFIIKIITSRVSGKVSQ